MRDQAAGNTSSDSEGEGRAHVPARYASGTGAKFDCKAVVETTDMPMNTEDSADDELPTDDEELWQLLSYKKPPPTRGKQKDLFIGNVMPGTTDDRLKEYVQRRANAAGKEVRVHFVTVAAEDENHELLRARIGVNARDVSLLLSRRFWPRGYVRTTLAVQGKRSHPVQQ